MTDRQFKEKQVQINLKQQREEKTKKAHSHNDRVVENL